MQQIGAEKGKKGLGLPCCSSEKERGRRGNGQKERGKLPKGEKKKN